MNKKGKRLTQGALSQRLHNARVTTDIDLASFRFFNLRAEADTDEAELASDIRAAQKQLGYSSVTMTAAYMK